MVPEWFYSDGDTRRGPVPEEALRGLAAAGTLRPTDLVWRDGMPDWVDAHTVPGLFPDRPVPRREPERFIEDDRPRPRRRYQDDDFDDRPRPRRRRREYDEYDDEDDYRRPRRADKPGQVTAVGVMMLVGGILGGLQMLWAFAWAFGLCVTFAAVGVPVGFCLLWPGVYFEIVVAILLIIRAVAILGRHDRSPAPTGLAVCQICCVLNFDVLNMVLGIVSLVMLNSDEARRHYRRRGY